MHVLHDDTIKTFFKTKINFELKLHGYKCNLLNKKNIMRWHDSGDIFNMDYFYLYNAILYT